MSSPRVRTGLRDLPGLERLGETPGAYHPPAAPDAPSPPAVASIPLRVPRGDPRYPAALEACLGSEAPGSFAALGNLDLLAAPLLALFCSVRCPGRAILETHALAHRLREVGPVVVGGFHSPMERECLEVLLRGPKPVVVCPARGIETYRLPAEYRQPIEEGRLLLLSPFPELERRVTAETAAVRNRFVAALAGAALVPHAEPGGGTEALCRQVLAWRKPLYTLDGDVGVNLVRMGAQRVSEGLGGLGVSLKRS